MKIFKSLSFFLGLFILFIYSWMIGSKQEEIEKNAGSGDEGEEREETISLAQQMQEERERKKFEEVKGGVEKNAKNIFWLLVGMAPLAVFFTLGMYFLFPGNWNSF